ncbi:MAG: PIN domain-containing protein [Thermodesulfobacteriota bacterium]
MTFLHDTTAFSDLIREHPKMDSHLASLSPTDRVVICSVVRGEIRYGIERLPQSKRRQDLEAKLLNFLLPSPVSRYQEQQVTITQESS